MLHRTFLRAVVLGSLAASAIAGPPIVSKQPVPSAFEVPLTLLNLRTSYVFESDFEDGRDASGDAWQNIFTIARRFPVSLPWPTAENGAWFLRIGAEYSRFDFGHSGGLPLPNHLQSANAVLALEYLVRGETAILLETAPGFYFENDVRADSFDAPTKLAGVFALNDHVFLIGGAIYRGLGKYPILPVAGLVWLINDQWTLRFVAPEPRLIYRPSDRLAFWVGAQITGGDYRVDGDSGRQRNLRHAVLTYSEYRAGGGFTWGDPDRCSLELGAGYAFQRKFDYHRAEEGFETDAGAPYVRMTLRAGF